MAAHTDGSNKICWVVTDGRQGIENQALGLAEAVQRLTPLTISIKRISVRAPFANLPRLFWGDPFTKLSPDGDALAPPWPDLWIATGRLSIPFTMAVKKQAGAGVFTVQTQDPKAPLAAFDMIVPPRHDEIAGPNVFPILGAPNRLTEDKLAGDAEKLRPALDHLPNPRVAVLIGGDSKAHKMSAERTEEIATQLAELADRRLGLMVSTSRRTGAENEARLKASIPQNNVFFWDGAPVAGLDNPYFGMLGLADHILVTEDSTNMASDAAFTGKPVHTLALDGGSPKFTAFHKALRQAGAARPFTGMLDSWSYMPLTETDRAAAEILRRWRALAQTNGND